MRIYRYALSLAVAALPSAVFGWGQKGHDVTAAIAQRHLTARTLAAVDSLLDGKSLVYWANWLDNASHTPEYEYSKTWHYKNVDQKDTFETAALDPKGDVVRALLECCENLSSGTLSKKDAALALKMIVHLAGDIHQPMHLGRYSDRGGNMHAVSFFDRETNLHSVWDSSLPEAAHKWSYTEWADQIDRASPALSMQLVQDGPWQWAGETYEIAKEVYASTPVGYGISYDYIARWTPCVEQQFLKGGLRLAYLLNNIFDPVHTGNVVTGDE